MHWCAYKRTFNDDVAVPNYYEERQYVFDTLTACVDAASTESYMKAQTISYFELSYGLAITSEYDEEATPIAEDDNETSHGFGFLENVWKARYPTEMA